LPCGAGVNCSPGCVFADRHNGEGDRVDALPKVSLPEAQVSEERFFSGEGVPCVWPVPLGMSELQIHQLASAEVGTSIDARDHAYAERAFWLSGWRRSSNIDAYYKRQKARLGIGFTGRRYAGSSTLAFARDEQVAGWPCFTVDLRSGWTSCCLHQIRGNPIPPGGRRGGGGHGR
jgi:hypothetical protein